MNRFYISVNLNPYSKWSPGEAFIRDPIFGLGKLSDEEKSTVLKNFASYIADNMVYLLKTRIRSAYYDFKWTPLSVSWLYFKKQHGLPEHPWEATGYMLSAIRVIKKGNNYVVGIPQNLRYPPVNGKQGSNVLKIARCLEYGTEHIPARPLFKPVLTFVQRHIRAFWNQFLTDPSKLISDV
jgi:hypothetical protein